MRGPDQLLWIALIVAALFVVVIFDLRDERLEADEEPQPPYQPGLKQSEHYQATWARVREYIDGWKHVNNGR